MAVTPVPTAAPISLPLPVRQVMDERKDPQGVVCDLNSLQCIHQHGKIQAAYQGEGWLQGSKIQIVVKVLFDRRFLVGLQNEKEIVEQITVQEIPHVCRLLGTLVDVDHPFFSDKCYQPGKNYALVFKHAGETLKTVSERWNEPGRTLSYWRCALRQILETAAAVEKKDLAHNDLSYKNVLIQGNPPEVTVIDWEASAFSDQTEPLAQAVCHYRAPEYYVGAPPFGPPADMWAIGCLFYQIATANSLFSKKESTTLISMIEVLGMPPKEFALRSTKGVFSVGSDGSVALMGTSVTFSGRRYGDDVILTLLGRRITPFLSEAQAFFHLMNQMLVWEPKKRIRAEVALQHPFFKEKAEWQ